jgi:hypothetical protein
VRGEVQIVPDGQKSNLVVDGKPIAAASNIAVTVAAAGAEMSVGAGDSSTPSQVAGSVSEGN